MDLNKFTERSQAALMEAQNVATHNQHQAVDVEHLVLAMLDEPATNGIGKIFKTLNIRRDEFLKHYHQRSNMESTFAMVKAR